jgi:hypothetical protein
MYPALARFLTRGAMAKPQLAFANKSFRGSAGSTVANSFIKFRTRSSVGLGTTT